MKDEGINVAWHLGQTVRALRMTSGYQDSDAEAWMDPILDTLKERLRGNFTLYRDEVEYFDEIYTRGLNGQRIDGTYY